MISQAILDDGMVYIAGAQSMTAMRCEVDHDYNSIIDE